MTTGSVTMEMEVFVQSTIHIYLEVGFDCNKDTNNFVARSYMFELINWFFTAESMFTKETCDNIGWCLNGSK